VLLRTPVERATQVWWRRANDSDMVEKAEE
jgi:hypothetical protein